MKERLVENNDVARLHIIKDMLRPAGHAHLHLNLELRPMRTRDDDKFALSGADIGHAIKDLDHWTNKAIILDMAGWVRRHATMPIAAGIGRIGVIEFVVDMAVILAQKLCRKGMTTGWSRRRANRTSAS